MSLRFHFPEAARTDREMPELFQLLHMSGVGIVVIILAVAFVLIRLGHAAIGLLRAWDDYRAERVRRIRRPPSAN
jgi:hypothetical protein